MSKIRAILFILSIVALTVAQPVQEARVVRVQNDNDGSGNFQFTYELDNGQQFAESGALKDDGITQVVNGQYSFVGQDGITYWVAFTADENGYQPVIGSGKNSMIRRDGYNHNLNLSELKPLAQN